ncbi:MAG: putative hemolysin [Cellvibrionaceae bacterium]|jgi:putative hemolysin
MVTLEKSVNTSSPDFDRFAFLEDLKTPSTIHAGRYQVRFAKTVQEIIAAQTLRYRVFYLENDGRPSAEKAAAKRDMDEWDERGFHIVVLDTDENAQQKVVGTLRLFFNQYLKPSQDFYTEETFDLVKLRRFYPRSVELSRFCIDSTGRSGVILMMIWKYAMTFLQDNYIDVMCGSASFAGTDVNAYRPILSYLYQYHLAPESLRPTPKTADYIDLNTLFEPNTSVQEPRKAIPTLLRGYLKLGAKISDAAIIDKVFNTTDIAIYVETKNMLQINPKLVMRA